MWVFWIFIDIFSRMFVSLWWIVWFCLLLGWVCDCYIWDDILVFLGLVFLGLEIEKNNISINKGKIVVVCRYFEVLLNIIFKLEENRNENIIFNFNVKIVLINGVESR